MFPVGGRSAPARDLTSPTPSACRASSWWVQPATYIISTFNQTVRLDNTVSPTLFMETFRNKIAYLRKSEGGSDGKSGLSRSISAVFDSFWSNHFLAHLECEMIMWQLLVQASRPFSLVGNICIGKRWSFNEGVIFIKQGAKYRIRVASLLHSDRCGVREKKCGDVTRMRLKCVLMLIWMFWDHRLWRSRQQAMNSMNLYLLASRQLTLNRRLLTKYLLPARYDTCDIIYLVSVTKLWKYSS